MTKKIDTLTWTPGPWSNDARGLVISADDPYGHGWMRIADLRGWGHLTGVGACRLDDADAEAIQIANAKLIAAAPLLYAALQDAWIVTRNYYALAISRQELDRHQEQWRAALRIADGQELS